LVEVKEKYDLYDLYDVKYTKSKLQETMKQIDAQRIRTKKLFGGANCYDENMNLQVNQEFINSVWQKFSEKYLSDEEE
jgi:chemotaxis receptor (MCP) glutamine deamidase CheD